MTNLAQSSAKPSRNVALAQARRVVDFVDRRITTSRWVKRNEGRAFPDHWSFWLGHIALFSFVVIVLSGIMLTLWFKPSMTPVTYDGAYAPLQGVVVSEAYASTLELSFEVRGGLLMRQVHYWATHVFIAAMSVHLLRVLFTGGFRTPRKLNWLIGLAVLVLGIVGGYTGHGLPDDLLSGTGLRVVEGGIAAIPIVGTYLSSFIFGGEFPGEDIVSRLYVLHVFVLPALIVALLGAHLILVRRQRHSQWSGPGRTNRNVVGSTFAVHTTKAGALFLIVSSVIVLMAATIQINPVWLRGPYDPSQVSAGSQPDWYMAFLDGALRLMPAWQIDVFGHELTLSVLGPVIVLPGIILTALAAYPWIEQKITSERGDQHILDRPRDMPTRTGLGVGFVVFYVMLWIAGGNDVLAAAVDVPVNWVTRFLQISILVMPAVAYSITKRICLGLQRRDRDKLLHGVETGITVVRPDGGFSELHVPLSRPDAYALTSRERRVPSELGPEVDENGIPAPRPRGAKLRARLSKAYFGDVIDRPAPEEIRAARPGQRVTTPAGSGIGDNPSHE
ncbi:MAG TPA: cytochrome bc complex cytochrome b subunit [Jiangellaceae bacterium]